MNTEQLTQTEEQKLKWISAILLNDENSTDKEMKEYFIKEGLTEKEADFYLSQRNDALLNCLDFELKVYEMVA
jgi:hypothetical protein